MVMYQFTWFRVETNTWCQREKYYKMRSRKIQNQHKKDLRDPQNNSRNWPLPSWECKLKSS